MKAISIKQFLKLLKFVNEKCHPKFGTGDHVIRTIEAEFDMGSGTVSRLILKSDYWDKEFLAAPEHADGLSPPLDVAVKQVLTCGPKGE